MTVSLRFEKLVGFREFAGAEAETSRLDDSQANTVSNIVHDQPVGIREQATWIGPVNLT